MMNPMRILMTADGVGGVWTHAMELARGLGERCEIRLVVFGGSLAPAQRREANACQNMCCVESNLRLEWMEDPWDDVQRAGQILREMAADFEPSVIHLNGYALAAEPLGGVPIVIGAHSCVLSWWHGVRRTPPPMHLDAYRGRVMVGLRTADYVVAPTETMLGTLRRNYSEIFRGAVIRNGVDTRGFRVGPKKPQILSVGRLWDEAKNIRLLDSIAAGVEWPIFAAGATRSPDGEEAPFSALHLLGGLSASGTREEMSHASIYASPAFYEPFGLGILEAALSGCALVLSDIPSLREIWGGAAVFVDPDDSNAWRATLNELSSDVDSRIALAARARSRGRNFGRAAMADRYHDLYQRLARQTSHFIAA